MGADDAPDVGAQRAEMRERWEHAAEGWGRRAQRVRDFGMPVSVWMVEQLALQPGQRVLELAAGPGETGFLAAELIQPGGSLVSSDGAEAMVEVARGRARELGISNVEFRRLELEWIDLPAASVDAALCRWGFMLLVDPAAAMAETRRVLRPGGRLALAVWDDPEHNPWMTIPGRALVGLGYGSPPDPSAPGPFALASASELREQLEAAGFVDVVIDTVELGRSHPSLDDYLAETADLSVSLSETLGRLSASEQASLRSEVARLAEPFTEPDGTIRLRGRSLVAAARA